MLLLLKDVYKYIFFHHRIKKLQKNIWWLCQVGKDEESLTITNLAPFTVYGVTVLALNKEGESSLPSAGVKVVTHVDGGTAHLSNTSRWI